MAIVVSTLCQDAMFQAGVLGQDGTTNSAADSDMQLVLRRLNRMLDSWATERLMVFTQDAETMALSAGTAAYSTSLLAAGRPVAIGAMWVSYGGVDYPIERVSVAGYGDIAIKNINAIPNVCWIDEAFPQMTLTLWPVPFAPMTLNLATQRVLASAATLTTSLSFPPGYEKAFVDCLAVDICPSFGVQPSAIAVKSAMDAKARLKALNYEPQESATVFDGTPSWDLAYICKPW